MKLALEQLKNLPIDSSRPLIVTDADEVILHFSAILSDYLDSRDMYVEFSSYALEGSIKYKATDRPVESKHFKALLDGFFHDYVEKQPLVAGAAHHLDRLSRDCDIVILTNIPHDFADRRRKSLQKQGIRYPLISSSGPKGPVLKEIRALTRGKMIFIDDIAHHHTSAAGNVADIYRIQYIASAQLSDLAETAPDCHVRVRDWNHIEQVVRRHLQL